MKIKSVSTHLVKLGEWGKVARGLYISSVHESSRFIRTHPMGNHLSNEYRVRGKKLVVKSCCTPAF